MGSGCYHFKFLEEIMVIIFLKVQDVINSNYWFLAILKEFSVLPLFKLTFFS